MPSKTLLHVTDVLHEARRAGALGLRIPRASADMKAVQARKRRIIADFAAHRARQLRTGKFALYRSAARFVDRHTVELADGRLLRGRRFLIATGSQVAVPPIPGLASTPSWTSDEVLELDFVPKSVIVLGGGIVACELAQFLRRIGTRVTLIQRNPNILRDHSPAASQVVQRAFRDEGIELFTATTLKSVRGGGQSVSVTFADRSGRRITRRARHLFNALGREPNTRGLNLEAAGVTLGKHGRVVTNRWQQSSQPHIYAGGDVCGPHDIVHLAVAQGELAARHAFGVKKLKPIDPALLLNVVFTDPPLATIGVQEGELRKKGVRYHGASYPFDDHGKSILMECKRGYVKVLADPRGRILGAEIVGRDAGELIHCFSGPLAMQATVFDLLRAPWYHPTLAEIITYPLEEIASALGHR
jgi:pyruvate/2-oxoglutarate dehydrogenase complex dihydrolipoamide dehydrogenase (E3) component